MKWLSRDGKHYSHPYSLILEVRGWSAWLKTETRYANLGREMRLEAAKKLCEQHKTARLKDTAADLGIPL